MSIADKATNAEICKTGALLSTRTTALLIAMWRLYHVQVSSLATVQQRLFGWLRWTRVGNILVILMELTTAMGSSVRATSRMIVWQMLQAYRAEIALENHERAPCGKMHMGNLTVLVVLHSGQAHSHVAFSILPRCQVGKHTEIYTVHGRFHRCLICYFKTSHPDGATWKNIFQVVRSHYSQLKFIGQCSAGVVHGYGQHLH